MEENKNYALSDDAALMTLEQLAAYLQVDPQTVTRLTRQGKIPYYQVGKQFRYMLSEVLRSLQHQPSTSPIPDTSASKPAGIESRQRPSMWGPRKWRSR